MFRITVVFTLIGSLLGCCLNALVYAQTPAEWEQKEREWKQKAADAYVFPVRPGIAEWAALRSYTEKVQVCQIPEHLLERMSTRGLVETCLHYPLLLVLVTSNSPADGIEYLLSSFNGLQALLQRNDAGLALLEYYQTMRIETMYSTEDYYCRFVLIELLLTRKEVLSQLSRSNQASLFQESLRVFRGKQNLLGTVPFLNSSAFIMATIMEQAQFPLLKERVAAMKKDDLQTVKEEILQKRPDLQDVNFTPILLSGPEKYHQFLFSKGMFFSEELLSIIASSAEQYLVEMKNGR